jgi:uncharacterized protein YgbK (DUF1537 family)
MAGGIHSMRHIAIIADDLTGASDSGVQFARKGLETRVIFDLKNFASDTSEIDAVVIDTDSRSISSENAYARVKEAAAQINRSGFRHVYKKLDSTLRGNLGAEIDAVMDEITFDFALLAPAFPKIGRTTLNGVHYLNGVTIDKTEIARDPKCPVKEADLVKLIVSQSTQKVGLVKLDTLHAGEELILAQIKSLLEAKQKIIVFDALTEEDMLQIAKIMAVSGYRILWVGSAGLAEYLPKTLSLPIRDKGSLTIPFSTKPVFLVAGSISQVTRSQVTDFNSNPQVTAVELDTVQVIHSDEGSQKEIKRCISELLWALANGMDVSLYASSSPEQVKSSKEAGALRGFDPTEVSNRIANVLGLIASNIIEEVSLQGVILTGGDTSKAVCKHLGVSGVHLIKEIESGVPLGILISKKRLWVVTKAGAFGNDDTLSHALRVLKGEKSDE